MALSQQQINDIIAQGQTDLGVDVTVPVGKTPEEIAEEERKKKLQEQMEALEKEKAEEIKEEPEPEPEPEPEEKLSKQEVINKALIGEQKEPTKREMLAYYSDKQVKEKTKGLSFGEKAKLGKEFEPMILGNLGRLTQAYFRSLSPDETFGEAQKAIEADRREKIYRENPEMRGVIEELESSFDAGFMTGRVGTAIVDPVTFFLPWGKIAKAGKLASVGAGAGVGVADMALYEKAMYGEVRNGSLAMAGIFGGAGSLLGHVVYNKFKPIDEKITYKNGSTQRIKIDGDDDVVVPVSSQKARDIDDIVAREAGDDFDNISSRETSVGKEWGELQSLVKQEERIRARLSYLKTQKGQVSIGYTTPYQGQMSNLGLTTFALRKNPLDIEIEKLSKELKTVVKKQDVQNKYASRQTKEMFGSHVNITAKSLQAAEEAGVDLTETIGRKLAMEFTRPIFGGLLGTASGALILDEDDPNWQLWAFTAAGAGLGQLSKQIQRSSFQLSNSSKKKVLDGIAGHEKDIAKRSMLTLLKNWTSGTLAAQGVSWGGPTADFFKRFVKQQGASLGLGERALVTVDEARDFAFDRFMTRLLTVYEDASEEVIEQSGRLINGFTTEADLLSKGISREVVDQAVLASKKFRTLNDDFVSYVKKAGIDFEEADFYGLTQIHNNLALRGDVDFENAVYNAFKIQNDNQVASGVREYVRNADGKLIYSPVQKLSKNQLEARTKGYINGLNQPRDKSIFGPDELSGKIFQNSNGEGEDFIIKAAQNLDRKRLISDPEARKVLEPFLENNPIVTFNRLLFNTVPVVEFSRTFGQKGEAIKILFEKIGDKYKPYRLAGNQKSSLELKELTNVKESIDAFFGLHHIQAATTHSDTAKTVFALTQAITSSTRLTKAAIPSLGDLILPIQNSSFHSAFQSYSRRIANAYKKGEPLPSMYDDMSLGIQKRLGFFKVKDANPVSIKLNSSGYKFLDEYGVDIFKQFQGGNIQAGTEIYMRKFFEGVGIAKITRFAREMAFDIGANEAYLIGSKLNQGGKITRKMQTVLDQAGLTAKDARFIAKQGKDAHEAYFNNARAKRLLTIAGRKSADRDALIPTVGNRRLFSQSKNPMIRWAGTFLSWAQAKTTQTNALITRVERGDAQLAAKMLGAIVLAYGPLHYLQQSLGTSDRMKEEFFDKSYLENLASSTAFSGNFPWYLDKLINTVKYNARSPAMGMVPQVRMLDEMAKNVLKLPSDPAAGLLGIGENTIPFFKDLAYHTGLAEEIENKDTGIGYSFKKGGEVKVPNAVSEPDELKIKGMPYTYSELAGHLFQDEEERGAFSHGGESKDDKGVLISVAAQPIISIQNIDKKDVNKLKKSLKKRQAKREGGKATRNYKKEYDNYHSSEKQKKDRAHRNNANRQLKREGRIAKGDGKDGDHKDGNPRNNSPSNLTVKSKHTNRTRKFTGGMLIKALAKRQAQKFEEEMPEDAKTYRQFYRFAREQGLSHPEAVAAQASLESGHGKSELALNQNNVLGIKVQREKEVEEQEAVSMPTVEYEDGKKKVIDANFRVFDDVRDSFKGYKEKTAHERYNKAKEAESAEQYLIEMQEAGYATDPNYADKTIDIMNRYSDYISPRFK